MLCNNCKNNGRKTKVKPFAIAGFYHGPHHYRFIRAVCPKCGEVPFWDYKKKST